MSLSLIKASIQDAQVIREIAFDVWQKHYPAIIGQEQTDYMLNEKYAISQLQHQIEHTTYNYWLIQEDDKTLGFIASSLVDENQAFIDKFYIRFEARGNKIGERAFSAWKSLFPYLKFTRLQVNRQNFTAINFYFKIGFTIEKVADFDIGNGYFMNDFIMRYNH
jgi:ribosomal protein S18 acetylase RimI-like enzyme